MTQIVIEAPTETETVCSTCVHFMESEGLFFCGFFEAFLSPETFDIPCDFQEKIEPHVSCQNDGELKK